MMNMGQFIPTEIIIGGRAHFDKHKIAAGHSLEGFQREFKTSYSKGSSNHFIDVQILLT